jgi:hypothetical protein
MTIPHMMNCSHQGEGWCLDCVGKLAAERDELKKRAEGSNDLSTGPPVPRVVRGHLQPVRPLRSLARPRSVVLPVRPEPVSGED